MAWRGQKPPAIEMSETYEEGHQNCENHQDQAADGGQPVADAVRDRSCEKDSNKSTALSRLEQRALPLCRNCEFSFCDHNTVFTLKGAEGRPAAA